MLGIQIVGIIFGLSIMYLTFLYYKRKEFTGNERLFWTFFAIAFIIVSLFPSILDPLVETFKFGRRLDLLIILGFMFLIGVVFNSYVTARKTQEKVERIVRALALKEAEPKNKRSKKRR